MAVQRARCRHHLARRAPVRRRQPQNCWLWRDVLVAETDVEAERVDIEAFAAIVESCAALRNRIYRETGMRIAVPESDLPSARASIEHGFIHGSPAGAAETIAELDQLDIGSAIATFRLGPMSHEVAANRLRLFMQQVAPQFMRRTVATWSAFENTALGTAADSMVGVRGFEPPAPASRRRFRSFAAVCRSLRSPF
jgi:hypothetical protein